MLPFQYTDTPFAQDGREAAPGLSVLAHQGAAQRVGQTRGVDAQLQGRIEDERVARSERDGMRGRIVGRLDQQLPACRRGCQTSCLCPAETRLKFARLSADVGSRAPLNCTTITVAVLCLPILIFASCTPAIVTDEAGSDGWITSDDRESVADHGRGRRRGQDQADVRIGRRAGVVADRDRDRLARLAGVEDQRRRHRGIIGAGRRIATGRREVDRYRGRGIARTRHHHAGRPRTARRRRTPPR